MLSLRNYFQNWLNPLSALKRMVVTTGTTQDGFSLSVQAFVAFVKAHAGITRTQETRLMTDGKYKVIVKFVSFVRNGCISKGTVRKR